MKYVFRKIVKNHVVSWFVNEQQVSMIQIMNIILGVCSLKIEDKLYLDYQKNTLLVGPEDYKRLIEIESSKEHTLIEELYDLERIFRKAKESLTSMDSESVFEIDSDTLDISV